MNYYDYGYSYNYGYDASPNILSSIMAMFAGMWLFTMIVSIFIIVCLWKVYQKAGKEGWEAIVPFYNIYVLFEISGIPGTKMFFGLIPIVGPFILFYYMIKAYIGLSLNFGKSKAFALGLLFANPIFIAILAFDKNAIYNSNNNYDNNQNQSYNGQYNQQYNNVAYNQAPMNNYSEPYNNMANNQMPNNNYNQGYNNVAPNPAQDVNYNQNYTNNMYMNNTPMMQAPVNEPIVEQPQVAVMPTPVETNINTEPSNNVVENVFNSEMPKLQEPVNEPAAPVSTPEVEEIVVGPNPFYTEPKQNTEKIDVLDINGL